MLKPGRRLRILLGIALLATSVWPIGLTISDAIGIGDWVDIGSELVAFFGHPLPACMILALALAIPGLGLYLVARPGS